MLANFKNFKLLVENSKNFQNFIENSKFFVNFKHFAKKPQSTSGMLETLVTPKPGWDSFKFAVSVSVSVKLKFLKSFQFQLN